MDKVKILRALNTRLGRTSKWLNKNDVDPTLYDSLIEDAKKIEGVTWTKSGRISLSKSALSSITSSAIKALQESILTPSQMIARAAEIIAEQAEDMDIDTDSISDREKVALAGAIIKIYDSYSDALNEFYDMREIDTSAIVDDEIRAEIEKAIIDISRTIRHPGVWTLPVSTIDQNKTLIGELSGKLDALKGGA